MPRAKSRYVGSGDGKLIEDFSPKIRIELRKYYPDKSAVQDDVWGHPADNFVDHILSEAWWAKAELHWHTLDINKSEIRAERDDLLKYLQKASEKLRGLSPGLDRLLGVNADPLGCADKIDEMIGYVESSGNSIEDLAKAKTPAEKQHAVAVEFAVRVLRVLKESGIAPNATGDAYFDYTSDAVQILKAIGDDMGLVLADLTWRDIILEAKRLASDLQ